MTLLEFLGKGLMIILSLACYLAIIWLGIGVVVGMFYGAYRLLMFVAYGRERRCKIVQEEHYGEDVWVNKDTEPLRHNNCLCLQCAKLRFSSGDCPYAQGFYENCRRGNIALMVTRCRDWQPKEK